MLLRASTRRSAAAGTVRRRDIGKFGRKERVEVRAAVDAARATERGGVGDLPCACRSGRYVHPRSLPEGGPGGTPHGARAAAPSAAYERTFSHRGGVCHAADRPAGSARIWARGWKRASGGRLSCTIYVVGTPCRAGALHERIFISYIIEWIHQSIWGGAASVRPAASPELAAPFDVAIGASATSWPVNEPWGVWLPGLPSHALADLLNNYTQLLFIA